jgi:hypothetical protein
MRDERVFLQAGCAWSSGRQSGSKSDSSWWGVYGPADP